MRFLIPFLCLLLIPLAGLADTPPTNDIFKLKAPGATGVINATSGVVGYVAPGASGNVLTSNGTNWFSVTPVAVIWGNIGGTLSNQTDLQSALNLKANISSLAPVATSGAYSSLTGKPTLLSQFTNDPGFITAAGVPVSSVFGRTGAITSQSGDYTTTQVTEGTNLYFTNARAQGAVSATAPIIDTGGVFSMHKADGSHDGYLSSTDWIQFNSNIGSAVWGGISGTLSNQTDLQAALDGKEPLITIGTTLQYYRGDKTFQTLNTAIVPELTNLYYTQGRFDTAFAAKSTTNLTEGSNLYFTNARAQAAVSATAPLVDTAGVFSITQSGTASNGYLSSTDWNTFNNKAGNIVNVRTVTASTAITSNDRFLFVNAAGATTVTLPSAAADGQTYAIKDVNSGTITVTPVGGATIDGAASLSITHLNESISLVSSGGVWFIW